MNKLFFLCWCCVLATGSYGQVMPEFKPLRYEEDYRFLKNDSSGHWYHRMKYTPLSRNGKAYLSLGGETRYQYFNFKNEDWGDAPRDKDGYILTRYLFHADVHTGHRTHFFFQLQSSLANGKKAGASPVDENQLDLHQAFADIVLSARGPRSLTVRLGRQELSYGSQRLVAVRDGPNNRQSFDAAKIMYARPRFRADAFYSQYVLSKKGIFDDGFNKHTKLWGSYLAMNEVPLLRNVDLYYLGLYKSTTVFDDGEGRELRHSVGSRIWKRKGNWLYDFEGLYQWGSFAGKKIAAWTLSSNSAYRFSSATFKPQLGLKTELISGDEQYADDRLNTFNPLFPRGAYFGLAALIGPANLADIHPSLSFELSPRVDFTMDYDVFWRYSRNDGIYAPNVSLIYSGKGSKEKFIGQQSSAELAWQPNPFLYFRAEFTWFKSGPYLKAVGAGKDILFTGVTAQCKV